MNNTVKIVGGIVAGVIVLGGIGAALDDSETPSGDTVATTPSISAVPIEPQPAHQPTPELEVTDDPAVEPGDQPRHIQLLALQMSWDDLTAAEQDSICQMGYMTGFDVVANEFLAIGESDAQFSRPVVRQFFEEACGL